SRLAVPVRARRSGSRRRRGPRTSVRRQRSGATAPLDTPTVARAYLRRPGTAPAAPLLPRRRRQLRPLPPRLRLRQRRLGLLQFTPAGGDRLLDLLERAARAVDRPLGAGLGLVGAPQRVALRLRRPLGLRRRSELRLRRRLAALLGRLGRRGRPRRPARRQLDPLQPAEP